MEINAQNGMPLFRHNNYTAYHIETAMIRDKFPRNRYRKTIAHGKVEHATPTLV